GQVAHEKRGEDVRDLVSPLALLEVWQLGHVGGYPPGQVGGTEGGCAPPVWAPRVSGGRGRRVSLGGDEAGRFPLKREDELDGRGPAQPLRAGPYPAPVVAGVVPAGQAQPVAVGVPGVHPRLLGEDLRRRREAVL